MLLYTLFMDVSLGDPIRHHDRTYGVPPQAPGIVLMHRYKLL